MKSPIMTTGGPPTQPDDRRAPLSTAGPLLLIALGGLLLLTNLGVLPDTVWGTVGRLWPFALIAVGADLLVGRTAPWGRLAAPGVLVLAAATGVWWTVQAPGRGVLTDQRVQVPLTASARAAELTVQSGAAQLSLSPGPAGTLVGGQVQTLPNERLRTTHALRGDVDTARLDVESSGPVSTVGSAPRWALALTPALPWTLDVRTGVGTTTLDLRDLRVSSLSLAGGVGAITVTLPARGVTRATLRAGVGDLTVRLPAGVAARITAHAGVGAVQVALPATRDGETYVVGQPDGTPNRADVELRGGVGRVRVEGSP